MLAINDTSKQKSSSRNAGMLLNRTSVDIKRNRPKVSILKLNSLKTEEDEYLNSSLQKSKNMTGFVDDDLPMQKML